MEPSVETRLCQLLLYGAWIDAEYRFGRYQSTSIMPRSRLFSVSGHCFGSNRLADRLSL